MSRKIVAGNWKMNKNYAEAKELQSELEAQSDRLPDDVKVIVAPPALYLSGLSEINKGSVHLSAQNCSNMKSGAFTGEIAANMLASINVNYCIVGHSERRSYYNESNEFIGEKVKALIDENLHPIFCCGESLSERENEIHFEVVKNQIIEGLFELDSSEFDKVIIAYEPVWAIGTGKTASPEQAQEMHAFIRNLVQEKYGMDAAGKCSILYGGSCKPSNANELFSQEDIDGGLIGGASLNSADFLAIVNSYS